MKIVIKVREKKLNYSNCRLKYIFLSANEVLVVNFDMDGSL